LVGDGLDTAVKQQVCYQLYVAVAEAEGLGEALVN